MTRRQLAGATIVLLSIVCIIATIWNAPAAPSKSTPLASPNPTDQQDAPGQQAASVKAIENRIESEPPDSGQSKKEFCFMPSAIDVVPAKWSKCAVLFDNGEYSVISGIYEERPPRVLGERWNGVGEAPGFPSQGGNPTWHVVPEFLAVPLLHGILDELLRTPSEENHKHTSKLIAELEGLHNENGGNNDASS